MKRAAPSVRFAVKTQSGRSLVIYARSEKAARELYVSKLDTFVTAIDGPRRGNPILLRELGEVVGVVQEALTSSKLVADERKAPGS
jgi:hypothetical protein